MTFESAIEQINSAILSGRLDEAEAALSTLQPVGRVQQRIHGHFCGILLFNRGSLVDAKEVMQGTLDMHGENLNLLRDLMVCQYHLQDMFGFRANLYHLQKQLFELEPVLTPRTLLECELMVGKFLEEEARLSPAFEFYERAHQRAVEPHHRLRTLIQKARWRALYCSTAELSTYYRELISVPASSMNQDLKIELEHSLMLIELRLIGSDHAWQRIERLDPGIPDIDRRLLYFDFLEDALMQDLEMPAPVFEMMNSFSHLDPYEEFIGKIAQETLEGNAKIQELNLLAPLLPWASYLRLLCLTANLESNVSVRHEIQRKVQLIVRGLDEASQEIWNSRLKQVFQGPEIKIEYSARRRSLSIQGRQVDLSKKKNGLQLLEGLSSKASMTIDEAIDLLWQTTFSPEHYHRLRMSIHRLNTLIHKTTGLGKVLEVDSQNVRLRPEITLQRADEVEAGLV